MKIEFICNQCCEEAIKWLKTNKDKINNGGLSNKITIEILDDKLLRS